jgi:hypothetical protein
LLTPNAFGNSAGDVVGDANGAAFFLPNGARCKRNKGNIVGQYTVGATTPGFYVSDSAGNNLTTINAPSGPDAVNAQGINNSTA